MALWFVMAKFIKLCGNVASCSRPRVWGRCVCGRDWMCCSSWGVLERMGQYSMPFGSGQTVCNSKLQQN